MVEVNFKDCGVVVKGIVVINLYLIVCGLDVFCNFFYVNVGVIDDWKWCGFGI